MAKQKVADVATKIVDLLTPLNSEERQRVVQAALTLVGEGQVILPTKGDPNTKDISSRGQRWMKQNSLKLEELELIFQIEDGKVEVIVSEIQGKGKKGKTINAYILEGLGQLLLSGDSSFNDKSARGLCSTLGCYDGANHAAYMNAMRGKVIGSKDKGWKLTAPGLKHGATLVKEMTKGK